MPQPTVTLAAGAPIPAQGVALWLAADDAQPGKLASWTNSAVAGVSATAAKPEEQPEVVAKALNGHNVVRFDGDQNMLMTNVDISPARMPEATIFAVFNSKTEAKEPLRKLYGDDNGGYDRAAGLDGRAEKNYTVFTGNGVSGYFDLKANETYLTADQFTNSTPAAPEVTSFFPTSGPHAGGTTVTVSGSGFAGASSVEFGSSLLRLSIGKIVAAECGKCRSNWNPARRGGH